jgi:aspartyl-tRNA(Asn)/glutamyl-tRNA(Gln) amidotransferase subunit C
MTNGGAVAVIDRATVEQVAKLSRLALTPNELDLFEEQLRRIIGYFDSLNSLNVEHVEPLAHPFGLRNVFREDRAVASAPREEALANAPARTEEAYKVPVVVDQS